MTPPPPQNPPSVSSSSKNIVPPKDSTTKQAPVKEAALKSQTKAPVIAVQTPQVAPTPAVLEEPLVLPLTPQGDHLDLDLIEEMEMENGQMYQSTRTPQGQAHIMRSIVLALKEQLKIAKRLMNMVFEDRRLMPLVYHCIATYSGNN